MVGSRERVKESWNDGMVEWWGKELRAEDNDFGLRISDLKARRQHDDTVTGRDEDAVTKRE